MKKNKKNIYCLLVILLLPSVLYAKSTYNKYLTTFNEGKNYYLAGNYTEAKNLLGEVIQGSCPKIDSITPYAQFYYALAAYYQQEKELSIATFSAIMTNFPTFPQLDEVYYWLGQIKLEQGNYLAALYDLAKINAKSIKKDVIKMERYFLSQIDDTTQLQELLDKLPNHSSITNVLFNKAVSHAFISQDFTLVNQLKAQYNIDEPIYKPLDDLRSKKKKSYNVAVFLPFFVDELIDNSPINNEFIIEFYQGLQLGQERLAADGIVINLIAYDTQKDGATTSMLLKQKNMQKIDLIIGPIYPETIPIVADFSKQHAINMFNPFSNNIGAIANNPFGFLLQPSLVTQGEKAAAFTLQSIANNGRQDNEDNEVNRDSIGVFYGTSEEDVTQANSYQQFIAANSDKEVDYILQMDEDQAKGFIEQYKKNKDVFIDSMAGLTYVYIASKNDLIVANVLTLFAMMDIHPYIIGHEDWVKKQLVGIDQSCNKQLRFLAPNYINYDNDELHHFRELFFNQVGCYPPHESRHFAHIGYDMMIFLGNMLYKHGKYFQKYWDKEIYKPLIFAGFSYGNHHTNQYIPIVQFEQGKFVPCN